MNYDNLLKSQRKIEQTDRLIDFFLYWLHFFNLLSLSKFSLTVFLLSIYIITIALKN
jgi:hypothetical protein